MIIPPTIWKAEWRGSQAETNAFFRVTRGGGRAVRGRFSAAHSGPRATSRAFTLIEIMVVVVLLSVVILGLTAMFIQTQRAFRLGLTRTDVDEAGRMASEMMSRELEQIAPSYARTNNFNGAGINFYKVLLNEFPMSLPANTAARTNAMSTAFFLSHENQTWTGTGYYLVPDPSAAPGSPWPVGALYRVETNMSAAQFNRNPGGLFNGYQQALSGASPPNVSKIMDGVVSLDFRAYDTNGWWINPWLIGRISTNSQWAPVYPDRVNYRFISNAVPAYVELEIGLLEQVALDHYRSLPTYFAQSNYLAQQAGRVHLFRQRVSVRNIDRAAY